MWSFIWWKPGYNFLQKMQSMVYCMCIDSYFIIDISKNYREISTSVLN